MFFIPFWIMLCPTLQRSFSRIFWYAKRINAAVLLLQISAEMAYKSNQDRHSPIPPQNMFCEYLSQAVLLPCLCGKPLELEISACILVPSRSSCPSTKVFVCLHVTQLFALELLLYSDWFLFSGQVPTAPLP